MNGNININGIEIQVYDDSSIQTSLSNKANITHHHSLEDISDIDITNKTDGNTLQYDSGVNKFVSKPLPTQSGSYLIELSRWGITLGIPNKPYKSSDFIVADNNVQGINNALKYAYDNEFQDVVIPQGQYSICYPIPIQMQSNITFYLNGSTLKVIYDSEQKSPFDSRSTTDYYKFGGTSILFDHVTNSHLINGIIIGCKEDRSFNNKSEAEMESSYGVAFSNGTSFSSVKHCVISYYMGDNITFDSKTREGIAPSLGLTFDSLSYTTGQPTNLSINTVITKFLNLNPNYESMMITSRGYAKYTDLVTKTFDIFFYDQDQKFLGVLKGKKVLTDITIPDNAKKFRMQLYGETNLNHDIQWVISWGSISHHNVVEHNELFYGHRGGITLGGNYNVIQHNVIRDNGQESTTFLNGKPGFPFPTRYAINQEDSFGDNSIIRNNLIYGSRNGLLMACFTVQIENNHIYNIDAYAILLYSILYATVRGNFIHNCGVGFGIWGTGLSPAYVNVLENSFHNSPLAIDAAGYEMLIAYNNFVNFKGFTARDTCRFIYNQITYTVPPTSSPIYQVRSIENCTFHSITSQVSIILKAYTWKSCTFDNIKVEAKTINQTAKAEKTSINECNFNKSTVVNGVFGTKANFVTISESVLIDTTLHSYVINTEGQYPNISIENSDISIQTTNKLFSSDCNRPYAIFKAERCNIEISNSNFSYIIESGPATPNTNHVTIKQCTIKFTGSPSPLSLVYYKNKTHLINFISTRNNFINITLPAQDSGIYIGYDPLTQNISEPKYGYYSLGQIIYNAAPTPGEYLGWVCITGGVVSSQSWTASKAYLTSDLISVNGHCYEAQTNGISMALAPIFPTSSGSTIEDKAEATIWSASTKYLLGQKIVPTIPGNYYYECTSAGTSGSSEVVWSKTNGAVQVDGTVTWKAIPMITWKEVGTPAIFKTFGQIST